MKPDFKDRIEAMNKMYNLPGQKYPALLDDNTSFRLQNFKKILSDEVGEIDDIVGFIHIGHNELTILTAIADLLGDIVVYCRSEAMKYGIPLEEVLDIIMDSNESKLGADGKPIHDETGKFLKGPNYWKPEPKIRALLLSKLENVDSINSEGGSSD